MKRLFSWKILACLAGAFMLAYGLLMAISLLPHPAVQIDQRSIDLAKKMSPRNSFFTEYLPEFNAVFAGGRELTQDGEEAILRELKAHEKAEYLVLRFRYGYLPAGERLREVVRDRGLKVVVVDHCYLACSAVLAASQERFISRRAVPLMPGVDAKVGDFEEFERAMDWRSNSGPNKKMTQEMIHEFAAPLKRSVDIQVVDSVSVDELMRNRVDPLLSPAAGQYMLPMGTADMFKVEIIAGLHKDPADLRETIAHEVFGHVALSHFEADGFDIRQYLLALAQRRPDLIEDRIKVYRFPPEHKVAAAEEAVALIAGREPELSMLDRGLASHRAWLRQNLFPNLYYTDREVIWNYILPMRRTMLGQD